VCAMGSVGIRPTASIPRHRRRRSEKWHHDGFFGTSADRVAADGHFTNFTNRRMTLHGRHQTPLQCTFGTISRYVKLYIAVMSSAVRNRGNLAEKSAGQHGCKRGNAALTAMPQRIRPYAA
jgi:hypothetical protein